MKHNVDILYVGALNDRIYALAAEVMSIPVDPVGTFPYQEMLRTLKERARVLYEDE